MSSDDSKVILITSSHVGEGKSSISSNLATVFAMQNKRTVLVDADMRRGVQYKNFGISNKSGLSTYLANIADEKDLIKKTDIKDLFVITSGPVPPNPAELLSTEKMGILINMLKELFEVIIIDGAPVLPVTDSVILSGLVDRVILVTSYGETHKEELKSAYAIVKNTGAKIAGVVLNKVDSKSNRYSKYGKYGGYYGSYTYAKKGEDKW